MKVSSILKFSHESMSKYVHKRATIIDATCGNGNDLYYLASLYNTTKIYAYDIQIDAINKSKEKCNKFNNITYINDSHDTICNLDIKKLDLAVYNLGYLPNSDNDITTNYISTIDSINMCLDKLTIGGGIVITIYTNHDNHNEEKYLLEFLNTLSKYEYNIVKYEFLLTNDAPYTIIIEKSK